MMNCMQTLTNKTIYPYFEQDELIDIFEMLIKELAKLENQSVAHRDIRPENFLIQNFDKHTIQNLQLSWTKKVNSLDISKNGRNFVQNDKPSPFESKKLIKRQSFVPGLSKINKIENLIAKKMDKNIEIVKVGVKGQEIQPRDLDSVKNVPKAIPITPANIYQKLVLNGLEGNLN